MTWETNDCSSKGRSLICTTILRIFKNVENQILDNYTMEGK
jgi:hypothetical protein